MELGKSYTLPVSEVFAAAGVTKSGLSPKAAKERLKEYGPNVLFEEKRFKALRLLLSQFKNFFVILLIFASILSFNFESAVNGWVLAFVVLLNVTVSFIQERKAEKTVESLRKVYPKKVSVVRGGKEISILAEELVVGDIVVLREGESVPADLRLFELQDLKIDEAVLTGESIPALKDMEPFPEETPLADRKNMAFVGTLVVSGIGKGLVVKTGTSTEFGRIAAFTQEQEERSLLLDRIAHLSIWLTGIAALLSLLIFGLGILRDLEIIHLVNFAIAVFVSAVPESLPTTTTLALALTALRLSRKKALVRHLPTSETLSGIDLFAFDKTGTLTLNEMSVSKVFLPGRSFDVTGTGFTSQGDVLEEGKKVDINKKMSLKHFVEAAAFAVSASILPAEGDGSSHWVVRGDPTEGAFLILAEKLGIKFKRGGIEEDFAFTSARRMRTKVFRKGDILEAYSLGAPEEILSRCTHYLSGGKKVRLSKKMRSKFTEHSDAMATEGYRVLAVATKRYKAKKAKAEEAESGLTFVGIGGLLDQPKERVAKTFSRLKAAGIKPVIITGDHPETALAVAKNLKLEVSEKTLMSGEHLEDMSDKELLKIIPKINVYARISPTQKHRLVKLFKELGMRVAVSGDGVNDAPALKKADVGVVMGRKGTDVSKEAADLVILDDNIETVLPAIEEARTLYDNIKKFFTFLLSGNFEELLIIAAALVLGLPQPFTTLQILWVNFVTDAFPAFALAYDPPQEDVLKSAPRDLGPRMVRPILAYALFLGFISLIGESVLFLTNLENVARARTMIFTGAVLFELFIVFSIRTKEVFWKELASNKYLVLAFLGSFALQILAIYFGPLSDVMSTVPLALKEWSSIGIFIALSMAVVEAVKWGSRRKLFKNKTALKAAT